MRLIVNDTIFSIVIVYDARALKVIAASALRA